MKRKKWFKQLPDDIRQKALANTTSSLDLICPDLYDALSGAFVWVDSPEGLSFWSDIAKRANAGEYNECGKLDQLRTENEALKARIAELEPKKPWWREFKPGDKVDLLGVTVAKIEDDDHEGDYVIAFSQDNGGRNYTWFALWAVTDWWRLFCYICCMACLLCYDLCEIIKGNPAQRIGAVDAPNENVTVFITNLGSGRVDVQAVEADGSGNVDIDMTEPYFENGQTYRIQVMLNVYGLDFLPITPDDSIIEYPCVMFTIKTVC